MTVYLFDIETLGLNAFEDRIVAIGYSPLDELIDLPVRIEGISPIWLAGFSDGEGSFIVQIFRVSDRLFNYACKIEINISQANIDILNRIKNSLGFGEVYTKDDGVSRYVCTGVTECKIFTEIVGDYILRRKHDLDIFKKVIEIMEEGKHLTKEGILEIAKLRELMKAKDKTGKEISYDEIASTIHENPLYKHRKSSSNIEWTDDEIAYLKNWYYSKDTYDISEELDRSPLAIKAQVRKLGLSKKHGEIYPKVFVGEEKEIIQSFINVIDDAKLIIGFNSDSFDVHFIITRGSLYGIDCTKLLRVMHLDMMWLIKKYLQTKSREIPKLKELALFLGIPVQDTLVGGDIPQLFKDGDTGSIINHCRSDIKLMVKIYKRMSSLCIYDLEKRYKYREYKMKVGEEEKEVDEL